MAPTSRRKFLQGVGACTLLPSLRTVPELVLYRANVITIDPLQPGASAVAIAGGRFLAVGDDEEMTCDGSISERTARLSQPYVGSRDDHGILVTGEDELYERGRKAHEADWQIGVHANGDVAIDITLRLFERLQRERPRRDPRFRIEHCTVINDDLIRRIAEGFDRAGEAGRPGGARP